MHRNVETLSGLGQGQRVRLIFENDNAIGIRVNQMEYLPGKRLRLEFTSDDTDDDGRYRAEAHVEDGEWTALEIQRYDRGKGAWTRLNGVEDVIPLETFRILKSNDMEAQERIGAGRPSGGRQRY